MNKESIKKLYEELMSEKGKGEGVDFLKSTSLEKFKKEKSKEDIPKTWREIYFKLYPRLDQFFLEEPGDDSEIFSTIQNRNSERELDGEDLSLEEINKILYYSAGIKNIEEKEEFDDSRRMYPSAGARYPLEIYPVILRSSDLESGIYHYNVKWDSLELLLKGNLSKKFSNITNQDWVRDSSMIIIINAISARTVVKYGQRGWRYIFFEAGHISQNIQLISTRLELKSCPIGGFLDEEITNLLDINNKNEFPLYLISIGK